MTIVYGKIPTQVQYEETIPIHLYPEAIGNESCYSNNVAITARADNRTVHGELADKEPPTLFWLTS